MRRAATATGPDAAVGFWDPDEARKPDDAAEKWAEWCGQDDVEYRAKVVAE